MIFSLSPIFDRTRARLKYMVPIFLVVYPRVSAYFFQLNLVALAKQDSKDTMILYKLVRFAFEN